MIRATNDHPSTIAAGDRDGATLLVRFQSGDRAAFAEFVDLHADHCYRLAVRLLGHRSDAEDATQSAFLQAFLRAATFRPGASARAWIGGIVANCCYAQRRRECALQRRHQRAGVTAVAAADPADSEADGDAERDWVSQEVSHLGENERLALWLRHGEGLRFRDIAERLGVPQKTVESRVQRALVVLRARLAVRARQDASPLSRLGGLTPCLVTAFARLTRRGGVHPRALARFHTAVADLATAPSAVGSTPALAISAASASGPVHSPSSAPRFGRPWRWWPSAGAVLTASLAGVVLVTAQVALRKTPIPCEPPADDSFVTAAVDHPAGTDLIGRRPALTPDIAPVDTTRSIRYEVTVLPLTARLRARMGSWPPGTGAVVVPAATVQALRGTSEHLQTHAVIIAWPGQTGFNDHIDQYAYIGDYDLLPDGPDPQIKVLGTGNTFTVRGILVGESVLITMLNHREVKPLRLVTSQFLHSHGANDVVSAYSIDEPEVTVRQAMLREPLAINATQGLLLRIPRQERHRIRAMATRSRGVPLTPGVPSSMAEGPSAMSPDDLEQVLMMTAEVVNLDVTNQGHDGAPNHLARR